MTAAELKELKSQAECLNLNEPFTLDFENGKIYGSGTLDHKENCVQSTGNYQS